MARNGKRPSFFESWLDDLQDDVRRSGPKQLIPLKIVLFLIVGYCASRLAGSGEFWAKPEQSLVFFAAIVTFNGLLLALSWGSFAKVYELASEPKLGQFLRKHQMLSTYIFHVEYIHYTQIVALSFSGLCMLLSIIDVLPYIDREVSLATVREVTMALSVASTMYALSNAQGGVRMMQDLVWFAAELSDLSSEKDFSVVRTPPRPTQDGK
jgi:hypothetical protein